MPHVAHVILKATTFRDDGTEAPRQAVLNQFVEALDGLEFEVEVEGPDLAIAYQVRVVDFKADPQP